MYLRKPHSSGEYTWFPGRLPAARVSAVPQWRGGRACRAKVSAGMTVLENNVNKPGGNDMGSSIHFFVRSNINQEHLCQAFINKIKDKPVLAGYPERPKHFFGHRSVCGS
jgi:hypothetical protein